MEFSVKYLDIVKLPTASYGASNDKPVIISNTLNLSSIRYL